MYSSSKYVTDSQVNVSYGYKRVDVDYFYNIYI